MKIAIDDLKLLVLNVGYAVQDSNWNWKNVCSPFARIYYVTNGQAKIIISNEAHTLTPGHLYIIPPFVTHSTICQSHFEHYYLHIYEGEPYSSSLFSEFNFPFEITAEAQDLSLMKKLVEINPDMHLTQYDPLFYDNQTTLDKNLMKNMMRGIKTKVESRGIVYILISHFLQNAIIKDKADDRIQNVIEIMKKDLSQQTSINEFAEMACMSKDHFIRVFKKETGKTPLQFFTELRMEKARVILATTDKQIKSIYPLLGYNDYSYFIKIFKKNVGLSPLSYRASLFDTQPNAGYIKDTSA